MKIADLNKSLRRFVRKLYELSFPYWQKLGFHIIPNHYYWPIPDTRKLKDVLWQKKSDLVGIEMNDKEQLEMLHLFLRFKKEFETFPRNKTSIPYQYYVNNGYFGSIDGAIVHSIIRYFKPKIIFEIGSGFSTYLSAQAVIKNKEENGDGCELVVIDPCPNDVIKIGFPGLSQLIPKEVQEVHLSEFEKLKENDILFIDSSHVLKIGSDVQFIFLEVLPRLNKGVFVHFHDIFLPAEYLKEWVLQKFMFWNEQYLLQAFLTFNDSYKVIWAGNYMYLKYPRKMEAAFDLYYERKGIGLGSFWMKKTK